MEEVSTEAAVAVEATAEGCVTTEDGEDEATAAAEWNPAAAAAALSAAVM